MENHPIPQDVTGFKFKLIGSVTVKQFLYLLGFGILATVAFVLPINFLFAKLPLMLLFAGIGLSLAFVPIEGRPMDVMIINFARTIPSENRYIFKKKGANIASFKIFEAPVVHTAQQTRKIEEAKNPANDKRALLVSRLRNSSFRPDEAETERLKNINSIFDNVKTTAVGTPLTPIKNETVYSKPAPKVIEADAPTQPAPAEEKQTEIAQVAKQESIEAKEPTNKPVQMAGFSAIPDVPNIVLGRLLDPRGKALPNILVEIIDSNDTPVRAFKTNAQGQFMAATPLPDGTYKIQFEDASKNHEFKAQEITLANSVFNPIEVTSTDAREKLRQELFGGNQT